MPNESSESLEQYSLAAGDVIADKYRIERVLGSGGMGFVVEAWHTELDERVAIKILKPNLQAKDAAERFEREGRTAFKIKSPHVCQVLDVGRLPHGDPYIVMEYLDGIDLGDLLWERGTLPIETAVDYILQAADAVGEAHALGILHRDLKPENLFLTEQVDGSPCIKVFDFGLSKLPVTPQKGRRQRALTAQNQAMGTPQYMSPEQWMSARDVGPAADIWALGVILFELIGGAVPFDGEQSATIGKAVIRDAPFALSELCPEVPAGLEEVINKCLIKRPEGRWPTVAAFANALAEYSSDPERYRRRIPAAALSPDDSTELRVQQCIAAGHAADVPAAAAAEGGQRAADQDGAGRKPPQKLSTVSILSIAVSSILFLLAAGWLLTQLKTSPAAVAPPSAASTAGPPGSTQAQPSGPPPSVSRSASPPPAASESAEPAASRSVEPTSTRPSTVTGSRPPSTSESKSVPKGSEPAFDSP